MGRVTVNALIENLQDRWDVERGQLGAEQARRISVSDALVDTGARSLSLPTRIIQQLGLTKRGQKRVNTSLGPGVTSIYDVVRLEIQGRECFVDVTEVPDTVPPLIGQIPLESMDFVVDPVNQKLIGNPAHGGEHIIELY
jgi:clan AA aspartic protease